MELHSIVLSSEGNCYSLINERYSEHLLKCLVKWYKKHLQHNMHLANEAVYKTIRYYTDHPKTYNPLQGSLARFLELCTDKMMQQIFQRENHRIHITGIDHILSKYFESEKDLAFAKLVLRNESDLSQYVSIIDTSSMRIGQLQSEIHREKERIQKKLITIPELSRIRKKLQENSQTRQPAQNAVLVYINGPELNFSAFN